LNETNESHKFTTNELTELQNDVCQIYDRALSDLKAKIPATLRAGFECKQAFAAQIQDEIRESKLEMEQNQKKTSTSNFMNNFIPATKPEVPPPITIISNRFISSEAMMNVENVFERANQSLKHQTNGMKFQKCAFGVNPPGCELKLFL